MNLRPAVPPARWRVLILAGLLAWPAAAAAQGNVGGGPLTGTLSDVEPTSGVLALGPIKVAPGIVVRELGWDGNVFDEKDDPKTDYVVAAMPDLSMFARLRFVQLSAYAGADLIYYQKYEDERAFGHAVRGRVDFLLSRMRPFMAGGQTKTRTRPNGEVDTRANRKEDELSGGLAFELGAHSLVYASAFRSSTTFEDAFEEGVDLERAFNRDADEYAGGLRTDLTPLLSVTLSGAVRKERFHLEPLRDADQIVGTAAFKIGSDAVVSGFAQVSYRDFKPVDPLVHPFRGLTGSLNLTYPILEFGRLSLTGSRALEFSFDAAEAYFLDNTVGLAYTNRLLGAIDVQVRGGKSFFAYGARQGVPPHDDTLETVGASFGYNLKNRTRVALNYEFTRRKSPAFEERNYDRNRVYLSWSVAI